MWIESLTILNCRLLRDISVKLSPNINLIIGDNASGKTSFLEALNLLASGKSFRTSHIADVISHGEKSILVSAKLNNDSENTSIGIEKTTKSSKIRINHQDIYTQAQLSSYLPITAIHPDSVELISGSPHYRRAYLDWLTFYTVPSFHATWKEYKHILKQRNICLKNSRHRYALNDWTMKLAELQPVINKHRIDTLTRLKPILKKVSSSLLENISVNIELQTGFPKDLEFDKNIIFDFYKSREEHDLRFQRTSSGVHRADLKITLNNKLAKECGSRGQIKLLVISLLLAQSSSVNINNNSGILFIDDLAAELDHTNKEKLINYIYSLNQQLFITSTKDIKLKKNQHKLFHVKHGDISEKQQM